MLNLLPILSQITLFLLGRRSLLFVGCIVFVSGASGESGISIPSGTWTMALTRGVPASTNGWEQLVYASAVKQSIMLSQYHQRYSETNESLVGYNFDTNSWDVVDMGGLLHTENIPEGGESQGYFDYNSNNNTVVYHCCTSGSNQPENASHTWWYDVLGQTGRDKHTSPKPDALQPGGAFDQAHNVFVVHGGGSFAGTWTYNPVTNKWQRMSTNGTSPNLSLILPALAYNSNTEQIYLFGGSYGAPTVYSSDLYVYDVPTNTWTLISPTGGVKPPARFRHAFAYDSTNNIFLMYGGVNASGVLGDTWIFNPATNAWTQVNPSQAPSVGTTADFARMAYDSDHNVFVLAHQGTGGYFGGAWSAYSVQTWLFRYKGGGPNAGALAPTAHAAPGSINRNAASWAKDPAITSSGSELYLSWSETGSPFDPTNVAWLHLYVSQYAGGTWAPVGPGYSSISGDVTEAHAPSIIVVSGTPWASWYQSDDRTYTQVFSGHWNGSSWQTGAVGLAGGPPAYQGRSQMDSIAGVPHVAVLEVDKSFYPQKVFAYEKIWNGTSWALEGTALNRTATGSTADSVSITDNGISPFVAWTEYTHTLGGGQAGDTDTNPQVYVSHWNGTQWVALGGSLNINPANWAYDASIAYLSGQPYVAWTERSLSGNAQLYVATWNGTSWVSIGSQSMNQNPVTGWAFHPILVANPSSNTLYVAWVEQLAIGQKAKVYVSQYAQGSWTVLGGALNADPVNGSAQRVSLTLLNGLPVAAWGEVNIGWLRQVYAAQWSGSAWIQLAGGGGAADTTAPTVPTKLTATTAFQNQISLAWTPSTDTVGVAGYRVYRGGAQIADVT